MQPTRSSDDQPAPTHHAWRRRFPDDPARRLLVAEVCLVLALSLGKSGVYASVNLIASATAPGALGNQRAVLNGSLAPGRPWLDLVLQLLAIGFGLVPALLVVYLLARSGVGLRALGFGRPGYGGDVVRGLLLAAAVGTTGLAFYLLTHALGVDLTVVAEALPHVWWRLPVLILAALQNALLEEVVVVGYLLTRLRQLGVAPPATVALSALVRGSYHLYQGLGGFLGNVAMGLLFGWLYNRWGRLTPLIIAHTLLDIGAFIGYALLAGHISWLPA
jgi:membrane protease YdiL (CAAX protease family)